MRSIDDTALLYLLAERFKSTRKVGGLKAARGMPPADPAREERQIDRLRALAGSAGIDPEFAETFVNVLLTEVIRHHERPRAEAG